MKDYSGWLNKAQAAEAIGVSTKTVEKLAEEKHLQMAMWKRPTGGAAIAVYHPGDVERIRKERNPDAPPFVLPSVSEASESSQNTAMVHVPKVSSEALPALALLVEAIRAATPTEPPIDKKLFLTLAEAASYAGLPKSYLHGLIVEGKLKGIKAGGWRIRRSDLEQI